MAANLFVLHREKTCLSIKIASQSSVYAMGMHIVLELHTPVIVLK